MFVELLLIQGRAPIRVRMLYVIVKDINSVDFSPRDRFGRRVRAARRPIDQL